MKRPRSISEFVRDKRKVNCPVCKVPPKIRVQVNDARQTRNVTMPVILEWLKSEHGIALTLEQCRRHYAGMHEGKDGIAARGGGGA